MKDQEFHELVKALRPKALALSGDLRDPRHVEFLGLCKKYLRKFHQLHDFAAKLSGEKRIVNVFFCKKPPC